MNTHIDVHVIVDELHTIKNKLVENQLAYGTYRQDQLDMLLGYTRLYEELEKKGA